MGWEDHKVEHQRLQLVMAYICNEASMTDLCKRYRVSGCYLRDRLGALPPNPRQKISYFLNFTQALRNRMII